MLHVGVKAHPFATAHVLGGLKGIKHEAMFMYCRNVLCVFFKVVALDKNSTGFSLHLGKYFTASLTSNCKLGLRAHSYHVGCAAFFCRPSHGHGVNRAHGKQLFSVYPVQTIHVRLYAKKCSSMDMM